MKENRLEIRRGRDLVETYRNYLGDVRAIGKHCGLRRAADVDMALWVLHEKCYGSHLDPVAEKAFQEDSFIMRIRGRNLVTPLRDLSDAQLANALVEVKPDLASVIGCYSFEILLRRLAEGFGFSDPEIKLKTLIDSLPNYGVVDVLRKAKWQWLKGVRDRIFHAGQLPSEKERASLIDEVLQVEKDVRRQTVEMQHSSASKSS
ncbi:MAG: hypothetical protein ABSH28_11190 [Acidobacteriota bacterium]